MESFLKHKLTRFIALLGILFIFYILYLLIFTEMNIESMPKVYKIIFLITLFITGVGNYKLGKEIYKPVAYGLILLSIFLGLLWFL